MKPGWPSSSVVNQKSQFLKIMGNSNLEVFIIAHHHAVRWAHFPNRNSRGMFWAKVWSLRSLNYSGLAVVLLSSRAYFTPVLFISIRFGIANIYGNVTLN